AWYYPYKEYADFTLGLDLMEKTGWKGKFSTEYTKRYHFSGSSDVSYHTRISPGTTYYDWSVSANHHHELGERSSFDANINFISNKRIWESSEDIDESLAQQLTSTLSYRRPLLNSYLNVSSSYTQDLINDYVYVNLPTASFSLPTRPVHEFFIKEDTPDTWWTKFNLSYNASLSHTGRITTKERSFKDIIWDNTLDPADTTYSTYLNEHHAGIRHNAYLSYNWKLFGWLNSSQGVSYTESWADRDKDQEKWVRGNAYSASSGLSFNIYGVRNFPGYKVSSLRHILTPNVSLNYSPDQTRNSRFYGFGSIGLPSGKESTYLSLSLSQSFQAKYRAKDGTQRRLNDFVTFNSAMPIDLQKDEKQMGNISHRMSFRPPGWDVGALRLGNQDYKLSAVKMAYSADFSTSQNPYQVHWTDLDLKNKYVTQSLTISGSSPYKDYFPRRKNKLFDPYSPVDSLQNIADEIAAQESSDNWNITLSHDLYTPSYLFDPTANNLRLNSTLKLTTNWSSTYSAYYSLKTKELLSQSFSLSRKLHCWQIDISYTRRNEFWEYSIVFFNTTLPESLKFETKDSRKY
ncbi:MAG: putative LPS assembly protein LptD, partial [Candidatus Cloacimonetes bacterium]|nr:putative LPS assembly protein LptD [Candidatus Cloacimonadota bacterium]